MAMLAAQTPSRSSPMVPRKRCGPYRGFALTPEGNRVAEKIRKRHAMLPDLFQLMGLDARDHLPGIEGNVPHLSARPFRRFAERAAHPRQHPFPRPSASIHTIPSL